MYRFKLKEIEVGDTEIRGGKKSTVSAIDDATGRIEWDIVDAADFSSVYKALSKANDFLSTLEKEGKAKDDVVIDGFAEDIAKLFNAFRTHVRKNYPKEYERVSRLKENVVFDNESPSLKAKIAADNFMKMYRSEFRRVFSNFGKEAEAEFKKIVKLKICQLQESVNEGHGLDQGDLDYLQFIADKNPDDTKLEKIIKFLSDSNILVDKTKDLSKGKEVEEQSSTAQGGASFTPGEGAQYATPFAFRKKGKKGPSIYYYKLGYKPVPKKIKGAGTIVKQLFEYNDFQEGRIKNFDVIEDKINSILPMVSNAKNKTAEYYNENPGSYNVNYPTDAILKELDDIIDQLKQANEDLSKSV